ncbi:MAG: hypothetical protein H6999_01225 [Hahellaceae bacterium]|nr:hypothetical protein [Hahellaceae bacterium]MCP5168373.1 hypothetical protein [Hahellaceae bacterium]
MALGHLIETLQPLYEIRFLDAQVLGNVIVASLGFAALGALLPLHMLRQADPATALRGA